MNTLVLGNHEQSIIDEACRLADTGRYADYTDIEHVLRFGYGLSDARVLLDRQPVRIMINRRCADARNKLHGSDVMGVSRSAKRDLAG